MPEINPITAVRYATENRDISSLIAPPYDVLDEGPKQELLSRDPANIVAVDLPVTPPKTLGPDSAYKSAGQLLNQWLEIGILKRDDQPAIFAYEQIYTVEGKTFHRRGIFTNLKIEDFGRSNGGIHRHELTIKGGTDDRLKLMQATEAQLSPIFGTFSDPAGSVADSLSNHFNDREPDFFGVTSNDNVMHRCWIVNDLKTIDNLRTIFSDTDVFIADGHHRYTTALNYHRENPDNPAAANCLFVLVAMQDPGMIVLPTHRIICNLDKFTVQKLSALLGANSPVTLTPTKYTTENIANLAESLSSAGPHAMGLYDPTDGRLWQLTTTADPLEKTSPDKPPVWRQLDVAILAHLVIDQLLRPHFGGDAINYKYTADLNQAISMTEDQPGRLAVIMQPTPLESVCEVSLAGEVMPPKSTFFFPKLATGLVINPLN